MPVLGFAVCAWPWPCPSWGGGGRRHSPFSAHTDLESPGGTSVKQIIRARP